LVALPFPGLSIRFMSHTVFCFLKNTVSDDQFHHLEAEFARYTPESVTNALTTSNHDNGSRSTADATATLMIGVMFSKLAARVAPMLRTPPDHVRNATKLDITALPITPSQMYHGTG
jgi:hypothetical protein